MRRTTCNILVLLPAFLVLLPWCAGAGELSLAVADGELAAILGDVPCLTINDGAPLSLDLSREESLVEVSDGEVSYRATDLREAADGYLRLRDCCAIHDIKISGTDRITDDAVRFRVRSAPGAVVHQQAVRADIEAIYDMGYFEHVSADFADGTLTFTVNEYPVVVNIEVAGNKKIKDDTILDAIGIKRFDILNTRMLKTSADRITALYREKGYYNVAVDSSREETEGGITLRFIVDEKQRLFVEKVRFDGNDNIKSRKLRKILQTKDRWPMGLFSHEGSYQDVVLDTDLLRIEQYYGDEGYINARVGRPLIEIIEDKGIYVTIPIEEGDLFHVGEIDFDGDLLLPKDKLAKRLTLESGDVMSKARLHESIEKLRDVYMDQGYAYTRINPRTRVNGTTVDILFEINKGDPVHIGHISISGNEKTRDKVIRRELKLQEQDLFSSTALKRSRDTLQRRGYFSQVNIEPVPEPDGDLGLDVNVEETTTGAFSFGMAYSSQDKLMGTVELSENNFLGYGLRTKVSAEYGEQKKNYLLDVEDPWFLDLPVSCGTRLYDKEVEELYYTKKSRGGNVRFSYPLFEEVRHFIAYTYEDVQELEDIDPLYAPLLTEEDKEGGVTSSIANTIFRDTTNDYFRPTGGSDISLTVQYAGLGGDYHFTRVTAKAAQFFPLYKDSVALMFKLRWGTINGSKGDDVPVYERFDLGGINSLRGFKYGEVGPRDNYGNFIGGDRMLVFNTEITAPVPGVPGLSTVAFYDAGNVYDDTIDLHEIKQSFGGGFRWVTPMGPLRLEYGRVINPEDFESDGRWEFSIGAFF